MRLMTYSNVHLTIKNFNIQTAINHSVMFVVS
jgi:hypothetical protein